MSKAMSSMLEQLPPEKHDHRWSSALLPGQGGSQTTRIEVWHESARQEQDGGDHVLCILDRDRCDSDTQEHIVCTRCALGHVTSVTLSTADSCAPRPIAPKRCKMSVWYPHKLNINVGSRNVIISGDQAGR